MEPNIIFQKVFDVIVSHNDDLLAIKNELISIYNGEMKYYFTDEYSFDKQELIKVMLETINIYVETAQTNGWARQLGSGKGFYDRDLRLDDVRYFCEMLSDIEIKRIMSVNPSFADALIENIMEVYKNPTMYFDVVEPEVTDSKMTEEQKVEEANRPNNDGGLNRYRAHNNLLLLSEALFKTQAKGTIGKVGYNNKPYTDNQMIIILNQLIHGNYGSITNSPLNEDNSLRDKISKISPEEIFAEILKNAIRLDCFCQSEKNLKKISFYGLSPVDIATLNKLVTSLINLGLDNTNVRQVIADLDDDILVFLCRSFILSQKDENIRNSLLQATMQDRVKAYLITDLDKIGDYRNNEQINNAK